MGLSGPTGLCAELPRQAVTHAQDVRGGHGPGPLGPGDHPLEELHGLRLVACLTEARGHLGRGEILPGVEGTAARTADVHGPTCEGRLPDHRHRLGRLEGVDQGRPGRLRDRRGRRVARGGVDEVIEGQVVLVAEGREQAACRVQRLRRPRHRVVPRPGPQSRTAPRLQVDLVELFEQCQGDRPVMARQPHVDSGRHQRGPARLADGPPRHGPPRRPRPSTAQLAQQLRARRHHLGEPERSHAPERLLDPRIVGEQARQVELARRPPALQRDLRRDREDVPARPRHLPVTHLQGRVVAAAEVVQFVRAHRRQHHDRKEDDPSAAEPRHRQGPTRRAMLRHFRRAAPN